MSLCFGLLWLFMQVDAGSLLLSSVSLQFVQSTAQPALYQPNLPPSTSGDGQTFGAPPLLAEPAEPCATETTVDNAVILSPSDAWEQALTDPAVPGQHFLLRAGTYQATDKLWLRAGQPDAPLLIKPYNCGAVTVLGSLRPNSHTVIAGIRFEAAGIEDTKWAIRIDGKNVGPLQEIVIRNNTIHGGTVDAIRVNDDVRNVVIQGNHIDGGRDGHDLFVTSTTERLTAGSADTTNPNATNATYATTTNAMREGIPMPDEILITQNRLTKQFFSTQSEDMFQVRDVGAITFTHNTCADGYDMEQCVDIKTTTEPLLIAYNLFDGATLHQAGQGEDGAGGCMVIHESDTVADTHHIEHNYFRRCRGTVIRLAPGGDNTHSSANIRYNLLLQPQNTPAVIPIEVATNVTFAYNTVLYGTLKLGNSAQTYLPENLHLTHNIFYQTAIENNMRPDVPYTCDYNLLYQSPGRGFTGTVCESTVNANPHFVDLAVDNFLLRPYSPAIGSGEQGTTLGAMPVDRTATGPVHYLFLPLMHSEEARTADDQ